MTASDCREPAQTMTKPLMQRRRGALDAPVDAHFAPALREAQKRSERRIIEKFEEKHQEMPDMAQSLRGMLLDFGENLNGISQSSCCILSSLSNGAASISKGKKPPTSKRKETLPELIEATNKALAGQVRQARAIEAIVTAMGEALPHCMELYWSRKPDAPSSKALLAALLFGSHPKLKKSVEATPAWKAQSDFKFRLIKSALNRGAMRAQDAFSKQKAARSESADTAFSEGRPERAHQSAEAAIPTLERPAKPGCIAQDSPESSSIASRARAPRWFLPGFAKSKHLAVARRSRESLGKIYSGNSNLKTVEDQEAALLSSALFAKATNFLRSSRAAARAKFFENLGCFLADWASAAGFLEE